MRKLFLFLSLLLFALSSLQAQNLDSLKLEHEKIEKSLRYQTGVIKLEEGNATLTVPAGFQFLDKKQSQYVLTDLWGNPADESILGLLVPVNHGVLGEKSWVFTISYDAMGYVKDDDAQDINYDDLLKEQQEEIDEANPERIKQGYPPFELVKWASVPYYDSNKKVLHWAKELKFGDSDEHTLNYNLRILGRKGIFMLNAVASMSELPEVKANIDKVLGSITFNPGSTYADYLPDVDNVAAWTIGSLVAGKILTKVGFLALILKFWKAIIVAIAAGWGVIKRFFLGRKKEELVPEIEEDPTSSTEA
ncbi:DUF2167 domain-containing protein [Siphonobacter sp. SORGH_AS_1065]|uniref:DUF2167 domain-containing protein n=1 Tax=Siphonobacter sp. SORGH_AS_1065 TaxID=3041795 RepID=UPI0027822436|nr:DUF2167 domain-containing protein [Siphonobacter sp. SORGH_AS_1065]MDQ1087013.1 putative membrane-anchored protein [Siphonobacter sp. SORGH_AS_1065]